MIKSRISRKLSLYFAASLLIFSIIIGIVFVVLFRNHTMNIQKKQLENRASSIANSLSNYSNRGMSHGSGYGAYMRFIGDIAGTDVWIVDENLNLIATKMGNGGYLKKYSYADLPEDAEKVVKEVFLDKTSFSKEFSGLLKESTLTVGVPIKNSDKVIGVVLLHTSVNGINDALLQGFFILFLSILIALIISISLAAILSYRFTEPINKMRDSAMQLAEGNYLVKTGIEQRDELGQLAETMDILSERLWTASEESKKIETMRREFVANISHELKTPITVIRGSLEALVDKVVIDSEMIESYYEQMLKETIFLQRLVGDLLDLSKLQNLDFLLDKRDISFNDIIDDVVRSAKHLAKKKDININVNLSDSICKINGDYGRLRQMLIIILDNAIKFSENGSDVDIVLSNSQLSVEDTGKGIKKEDLPYIFERFYKAHTEENKNGTGLGLAIAKEIANRHNIDLSVESDENKGTKFILKIAQK